MNERRRVHELDRDGRVHQPVALGRRRAGREPDEQRPQPLAAGRNRLPGVAGEQRPVAAGELGHPPLDAVEQAQHRLTAEIDDSLDRAADAHRGPTSPTCRAMMPARGQQVANPAHPRAPHQLGELPGSGEAPHRQRQVVVRRSVACKATQRRDDPVEPQLEEVRQRRARRGRDLQNHDPPIGPDDSRHLREPTRQIRKVPSSEPDGRGVERAVFIGQRQRVRHLEAHRRPGLRPASTGRLLPRQLEHPL